MFLDRKAGDAKQFLSLGLEIEVCLSNKQICRGNVIFDQSKRWSRENYHRGQCELLTGETRLAGFAGGC